MTADPMPMRRREHRDGFPVRDSEDSGAVEEEVEREAEMLLEAMETVEQQIEDDEGDANDTPRCIECGAFTSDGDDLCSGCADEVGDEFADLDEIPGEWHLKRVSGGECTYVTPEGFVTLPADRVQTLEGLTA